MSMALVDTIIEIRSYYDTWLVIVDIEDDITGQQYHYRWHFDSDVDETSNDVIDEIIKAKENIQAEILYIANMMNLPADEEIALEYLQNIKQAIVLEIRNTPAATLAQAQAYIDNEYPDAIVDFTRLYQWYLNLLGLTTWDEFKSFVINSKFRGID
jgi:hypothetical protein